MKVHKIGIRVRYEATEPSNLGRHCGSGASACPPQEMVGSCIRDVARELAVRRTGDGDAPSALELVGHEARHAPGNPADDRLRDMQDRQAHRAR